MQGGSAWHLEPSGLAGDVGVGSQRVLTGPAVGEQGGLATKTGRGQGRRPSQTRRRMGRNSEGPTASGSPRGEPKSAGQAPPHPPTGRTENRLRVYHLQDVSDRHQLDAQPPSSQPLPREGRRSHCAAGPEGSRLVLRAGRPACRQSVGLSEPRAILQRRTEGAECHRGARAAPHPRFPCTAPG